MLLTLQQNSEFIDVLDWGKPYVNYAKLNNITSGIDETHFSSDLKMSFKEYANNITNFTRGDTVKTSMYTLASNKKQNKTADPAFNLETIVNGSSLLNSTISKDDSYYIWAIALN